MPLEEPMQNIMFLVMEITGVSPDLQMTHHSELRTE